MKNIVFITVTILVLCFSCKHKNKLIAKGLLNDDDISSQNTAYIERYSSVLKEYFHLPQPDTIDIATSDSYNLFAYQWSKDYYSSHAYTPIWTNYKGLSEVGTMLLEFVKNDKKHALIPQLYPVTQIDEALTQQDYKNVELLMMDAYMLLSYHLDSGAYNFDKQKIRLPGKIMTSKYGDILHNSLKDGNIIQPLLDFSPTHSHYTRLWKSYTEYITNHNLTPKDFNIRDYKTDSAGCMKDVAKALIYHQYLTDSTAKIKSEVISNLKKFQRDSGLEADGTPGANTRKALLRDYYDQYRIFLLNIDRWRGASIENFPEKYIWVNIPSFIVQGIENDSIKKTNNAVVGTPKTQTPTLISAIDKIVLFPEWSIPQSIIKNEMKGKSTGYLNKYKIYQNGKRITASQINWSKPVRMVQPSGYGNSLGIIKFLFPNKHSVYLHDTPSKSLFDNEVRAYSHGCVRVEKPLSLAAYILTLDGKDIAQDSLDTLIKKHKSITFTIKDPLPIYIQYFTAYTDHTNKLHFYSDVYDYDELAIKKLYKQSLLEAALPPVKTKVDSIALRKKDSLQKVLSLKRTQDSLKKLSTINDSSLLPTADTLLQSQ